MALCSFILIGPLLLHASSDVSFKNALGASGCPHSFRIGAATEAAINGVLTSQIQSMGRWRSQAVRTYIQPDRATSLPPSSRPGINGTPLIAIADSSFWVLVLSFCIPDNNQTWIIGDSIVYWAGQSMSQGSPGMTLIWCGMRGA